MSAPVEVKLSLRHDLPEVIAEVRAIVGRALRRRADDQPDTEVGRAVALEFRAVAAGVETGVADG